MIETTTIAWAAGLFEGEGYIYVKDRRVRVAIHMTDLDILERFLVFGGSIRDMPKQADHHKRSWRWEIQSAQKALTFLDLIYPYLGHRRSARVREARGALVKNNNFKNFEMRNKIHSFKDSNLKQSEIAEIVGCSREHVNKVLRGKR